MKNFSRLLTKSFITTIALITCFIGSSIASELKAPKNEFFMTYKSNGKFFSLDHASLKTISNDVRYSIGGASSIQGDINTIVIRYTGGIPSKGTFSTSNRNVVFILGGDDGESSTLDLPKLSFGTGKFSITEITDTFAKGTFSFVTYLEEEGGPKKKMNITDGLFKARIMKY